MKTLFIITIFIISNQLLAEADHKVFRRFEKDKYVEVKIFNFNETRVNEACLKNHEKCHALRKLSEKPVKREAKTVGHPANDFCLANKGLAFIMLDKENNQYNFCEFQDGSLADSWDLYYKNGGK